MFEIGDWSSFEVLVILLLSTILIVLAEKEERAGHKPSQWPAMVGYIGFGAVLLHIYVVYV